MANQSANQSLFFNPKWLSFARVNWLHFACVSPIRLVDVDLEKTLETAKKLDIYAYDAYFIVCAQKHRCQLIFLDSGLLDAAKRAKVESIEVIS